MLPNLIRIPLFAFLLTYFPSALADTPVDLFEMPLEELTQLHVNSSTLTDKTLRTAPSSITVFTHQQIQNLGINYLHELMNYVPGFQAFRQAESGDEYYHSSRGLRTGTSSREVLILLDGQRLNREFDNAIGIPMMALGNIEKVEFIRGPGSAIYGSNAFTGVISITTTKNKNETTVNYGSNHNTQGQILSSGKIEDAGVDLYANIYRDDGTSYQLQNPATLTPYASRDPREGQDFNLKLGGQDKQLNIMHSERQSNDFYVLESVSNTFNETRNRYSSIQFQQNLDMNNYFKTDYNLRYNQTSYFAQSIAVPPVANIEESEHATEFNVHNDWTINVDHSMQFGLEQRHIQNDKTTLNTNLGPITINEASNRDVTGVYVQSQNTIMDRTDLTVGARYDHYSQVGSAFNPRFGLIHQLSDVQTVKLLYGRAFRAPTITELTTINNPTLLGNPNLKPETIETWELVWMGNWKNHSLTVTGFDNCVDDGINQGFIGPTRTFVNDSNPERSQGIEIEYMTQLTTDWQLRTTYSFFNTLPASAFRQADTLASAIVNYHKNQWNINVSATYNDQREMMVSSSAHETLGGYWLLNSKWQYAFNDQWSAFLQANNILNKDYLTPSQGRTLTEGIPNRGRELSLGVRWGY